MKTETCLLQYVSQGGNYSLVAKKNILGSLWTFGNTAEFIVPLGPFDYSWSEYRGDADSSVIYLSPEPIAISHTAS